MPSRWQSNPFRLISGPVNCKADWNRAFTRTPIARPTGRGVTRRHRMSLISKPAPMPQAGPAQERTTFYLYSRIPFGTFTLIGRRIGIRADIASRAQRSAGVPIVGGSARKRGKRA